MKIDTRNLEKEIENLEQAAKTYFFSGNPHFEETMEKLNRKKKFLEALRRCEE